MVKREHFLYCGRVESLQKKLQVIALTISITDYDDADASHRYIFTVRTSLLALAVIASASFSPIKTRFVFLIPHIIE